MTHETALRAEPDEHQVVARLSTLDRFLPVWIGVAMASGILLGKALPGLDDTLDRVKVDTVSLPIAVGLLAMMYPVLAKVKYGSIGQVVDRRSLVMSLLLNWLIGPALVGTGLFIYSAVVILRKRSRLTGPWLIVQGLVTIGLSVAVFLSRATEL